MATLRRRLESTPSRRRQAVDDLQTLIEAFINHQRAQGRSEATIRHYEDSLLLLVRCFTEKGIALTGDSLTAANMNIFSAWLRATPTRVWRGKTKRSIHGIHGALKDIKIWVKWLAGEELLEKAPKVLVPRLPQTLFPILTETDLEVIFACQQLSNGSEIAVRNRALVAFMVDTGVRLAEVSGLTYANLLLKDAEAKIRGKGGKERMVYFSQGVTEAIAKWVAIRGAEDGLLFWLAPAGVRMLFKRIKDETGLPLLTCHQVRHTALTLMIKNGMDLHSVKRVAGHASVTTTESYLALAGADIKDKHSAASPFDLVNRRNAPIKLAQRRLKSA